jgi:hypothetical protein
MSANSHIGDGGSVLARSNEELAGALDFDALKNQYGFIRMGDAVLNHPGRGAACGRSSRWIFYRRENASGAKSHLRVSRASADKIETQPLGGLSFQVVVHLLRVETQRLESAQPFDGNDGKGQAGRNRLNRKIRFDFGRIQPQGLRDFAAIMHRAENRGNLPHLAEQTIRVFAK